MIRIWISRRVALPIRDQLSSQLLLGILSKRLAPGEKLPSVRDFARRLKVHSNTVSASYSDLARRGWVESRAGSGVYVTQRDTAPAEHNIDAFVREIAREAEKRGFSPANLRAALDRIGQPQPKPSFLAVDPDPDLARILAAEVEAAISTPVEAAIPSEAIHTIQPHTFVLASTGQSAAVQQTLGGLPVHALEIRSLPEMIESAPRPEQPALICVVSRSKSIRTWAATLIAALGISPDAVLLRDPATPGWTNGLRSCGIVGADIVSAREIPRSVRPFVFRIVADRSLQSLRQVVTA